MRGVGSGCGKDLVHSLSAVTTWKPRLHPMLGARTIAHGMYWTISHGERLQVVILTHPAFSPPVTCFFENESLSTTRVGCSQLEPCCKDFGHAIFPTSHGTARLTLDYTVRFNSLDIVKVGFILMTSYSGLRIRLVGTRIQAMFIAPREPIDDSILSSVQPMKTSSFFYMIQCASETAHFIPCIATSFILRSSRSSYLRGPQTTPN